MPHLWGWRPTVGNPGSATEYALIFKANFCFEVHNVKTRGKRDLVLCDFSHENH